MLDEYTIAIAAEIILDHILTPVLYMYADEAIEFICFPDGNITEDAFERAEAELYHNLGINAEIVDIRSFDEADRVEVTKTATLVYAENDLVRMLFEAAMAADCERIMQSKRDILSRRGDTGTYYTN